MPGAVVVVMVLMDTANVLFGIGRDCGVAHSRAP